MKYFDYDYGLHHDERRSSTSSSAGPPRKPETLHDRARVRHRGLGAEGVRGDRAAHGAPHPQGDRASATSAWPAAWPSTAWPTARVVARDPDEEPLRAARGRRRRRRGRASPTTSTTPSRSSRRGKALDGTPTSAPNTRTTEIEAVSRRAPGAKYRTAAPRGAAAETARVLRGRPRHRLVPGTHGVRPARAGRRAASWPTRATRRCATPSTMKIKFREGFRPFAPSVLAERRADWFEHRLRQPLHAAGRPGSGGQAHDPVRDPRRQLGAPADGDPRAEPALLRPHRGVREDHRRAPLINTSFNVRGEPIVCTPDDAYLCFMRTNMDYSWWARTSSTRRSSPRCARTWTGAASTSTGL